jgi:hypothetical protein
MPEGIRAREKSIESAKIPPIVTASTARRPPITTVEQDGSYIREQLTPAAAGARSVRASLGHELINGILESGTF